MIKRSWSRLILSVSVTVSICASAGSDPADTYDPVLIERLRQTRIYNEGDYLFHLKQRSEPFGETKKGFDIPSPYVPQTSVWSIEEANEMARLAGRKFPVLHRHKRDTGGDFFGNDETVSWWFDKNAKDEVCAIKFKDTSEITYDLKTFPNKAAAESIGYKLTHYGRCGACSSLKDLAVYLSKGLTAPARNCGRKILGKEVRRCLIDKAGFTPVCASAWAYNSDHTKKYCKRVCIKDYGFRNVFRNHLDGRDYTHNGRLSECLKCDENISGMGFKSASGRTRRNSGIVSEIEREEGEVLPVDHHYFKNQP